MPIRLVLMLHERGSTDAGELAQELRLPTPRVGYHLRRLKAFGIVEITDAVVTRGAVKHVYTLAAGALSDELLEHARRRVEDAGPRSVG